MKWGLTHVVVGEVHVWPLDDLREHDLDETCWCLPLDDDGVTVHNSMDKRESYERGRKLE